jgi:hypothetical protein
MKPVVRLSTVAVLGVLAGGALLSAQQAVQLPSEPARGFGAGITASYEGWFDNPDGSHNFLVGYMNRNRQQEVDVPIGPNNRIEPGGPDMGQPTHFLPGRQIGLFIVTVPKEFTREQRLTWTITVNGQTTSIPFRLLPDYNVSPLMIQHGHGAEDTPPIVRFEEKAPPIQGPVAMLSKALTRTASAATPLALNVWAEDDAKYSSGTGAPLGKPRPPVSLTWSKFRGTGAVTFDKAKPELKTLAGGGVNELYRGTATTTVKFSEPGDYVLHLTANDFTGEGGGGEICCWTTAMVKVTVK